MTRQVALECITPNLWVNRTNLEIVLFRCASQALPGPPRPLCQQISQAASRASQGLPGACESPKQLPGPCQAPQGFQDPPRKTQAAQPASQGPSQWLFSLPTLANQNSLPLRIRRSEETGGLEPNLKPNLLLVATGSRLDSLQAKSLEPGPTKHCTRLVYTGRRNKKEDRSARDFFWRKLGASSQPQIQTLCSSGLDRCN